MGMALFVVLLCTLSAAACAVTNKGRMVALVDAEKLVRELPDRSLFGLNLSFASRANHTWDPKRSAFKPQFWRNFTALNPGLLRYPGGNWCYGFHFNLAREGIPHRINTGSVTPHYRPQDFLKTIRQLPDARALIHLSPIWSSPEEAAAFIAYMIGKTDDKRSIGVDSWRRVDPQTKKVVNWQTVAYWARLRERDGERPYRGTLYFQVGNEEWIHWCKDGTCEGKADYYGRVRPVRQMTVEDVGLKDPKSKVPVEAYWPHYRATYLKIRKLFDADQVKVGALLYAKPDGMGGADSFFGSAGGGKRWNVELLDHLNRDPLVSADFVTLHTYMYDKNGWEKDFPNEGSANLLFASNHLAARIQKIFAHAKSPPYPVMVTEFNIHLHNTIAPSSLLSALFYVDYTMGAMHNYGITGLVYWQTANWRQQGRFNGGALFVTDARPSKNDEKLWKMGPYYAAKLIGKMHRRIVHTQIDNPPVFMPKAFTRNWKADGERSSWWSPKPLPLVTAVATRSEDNKGLSLLFLNKSTKEDFDLRVKLSNFAADENYTKIVLNSAETGGHQDIFKINPWRLTRKSRCAPPDGGCTRNLGPESGEKVMLKTSSIEGAQKQFSVTLAAHSATLLQLVRENDDYDQTR